MTDVQAVLYVEDDDLIRELSAVALEEVGFKVVVAESGTAASMRWMMMQILSARWLRMWILALDLTGGTSPGARAS